MYRPRLDLLLLARRAGLNLTLDVSEVLGEFQVYCMAGRYPDAEPRGLDRALAERELSRANEAFKWLQQQFSK